MTRRWGGLLRAAAAATVVVAAASACSAGAGLAGPSGPDTLTVALTAKPDNLDFTRTAGAAIPQALLDNVYEGLVRLDDAGTIVPLLAASWTVSDDRTVYDFALREDATFSNGAHFTSDDVKFSIERVKTDWTANSPAAMAVVDRVETPTPHLARVVLSRPSNEWLFAMTGPVGAMFTPGGVGQLATTAIGTGPFTVARWNPGSELQLAANPRYWGSPPPMKNVRLRYFSDATAQANALRSGGVDVIYGLGAPQLLGQFAGDSRFTVTQGTTNGEVTLSMNGAVAPFDDIRVRRAVMYAVDRKAVRDTAYAGYGELIGSMVPPTDPWYEDLTGVYPFDPDRARALLAEAGNPHPVVRFDVPNLPYATAAAQVVSSQLQQVGFAVRTTPVEFPAVWLDSVFTRHDYQMSVIQHSEPHDIATFGNPKFYWGYDNPAVTRLLAEADAADRTGYVAAMREVARTITDDAAADWLFLFPLLVVADADLTGLPRNSTSLALDLSRVRRG
ncbi:ABC transporter substrate-binding protein [Rhodococcus spelaei]|uniref:ABC transporter substrate-binding protein n=1 Tax=Rhodococcus spelaei TaxID=2546320 RepID=A0A541B7V7_9NOCA|nr:ABC transporter substrate-binding protein [Rhodococcus spelaei]TQF68402.1 ABC transporter substrate-binding protein [Rhodococcus spelaei]